MKYKSFFSIHQQLFFLHFLLNVHKNGFSCVLLNILLKFMVFKIYSADMITTAVFQKIKSYYNFVYFLKIRIKFFYFRRKTIYLSFLFFEILKLKIGNINSIRKSLFHFNHLIEIIF